MHRKIVQFSICFYCILCSILALLNIGQQNAKREAFILYFLYLFVLFCTRPFSACDFNSKYFEIIIIRMYLHWDS